MSAASRLFERATSFHHQLRQRAAFAGKRVRPARLAANALEPLEQRMMLTAVHWTGLGDGTSWSDGQNWDTLAKPGNGDDVTISVAADPTILFNAAAGAANLNSLVSDEAINFTGGTFHATTFTQNGKPISISSGTIQGGTLTLAGGAAMLVNGTAGVLDGVTVNGDIDLATTNLATIDLRNTVTVNGRISIGNLAGTTRGNLAFGGVGLTGGTLAGNAEVLFGANASNFIGNYNGTGAATATLGANVVIHGHSGQIFNNYAAGVIVNQGQINADVSGGTISFNGATFTNNGSISAAAGTTVSLTNFWTNAAAGTITATGATLALGYSFNPWSNPGSITAANSTVNITGSYSSDIFLAGHFTRTGGTVNVSGALNNAGKTIALNAALGSWNLVGVTITGGTINASAGSMLVATATDATFDGLTLNGDLDIAANHQAAVDIKNTVTVNGKISVGNLAGTTRGILEFGGAALTGGTLAGNAEVLFGGHASNLIINYNNTAPATATLGPNVVVHGKNGQINNNYAGGNIVNQGQINADVSGGQISFSGATFTNNGSISAAAGTTVSLTNLWTNAATGTITASGATLALGYSFNLWSNPGSITASNSTVNITGTYSSDVFLAGHFTRTGGTVNVSGALNNAGKTIALNAALGSWNLVGVTITGGTIDASAGSMLVATATDATFDGLTLNGDLDIASISQAAVDIKNTVTVNGKISVGNLAGTTRGILEFGGAALTGGTLTGNAEVLFGGNVNNIIINYNNTLPATATLGPNVVVHGKSGQINNNYANGVIVNQGQINADVSGGQISFNGATFINNGAMTAAAGTTLGFYNLWTNNGTIVANGATLNLGLSTYAWANNNSIAANNTTVNITGSYAGPGNFVRTGGVVNLAGLFNNTGKVLNLNASLGSWNLVGVAITGGTINASAGSMLVATATDATFDGLTYNGDLDIATNNQAAVDIKNTVTINGKITVGNAAGTTRGILEFGSAALTGGTLTGNAEVLFGGNANNVIINYNNTGAATANLGPSVLVHGKSGQINNNYAGGTIASQATIKADAAGAAFSVNGGKFSSAGSLISGPGANFAVNVAATLIDLASLSGTGSFSFASNALGDTDNAGLFNPQGATTLNAHGTALNPQQFEAMSADLGAVAAGLVGNFAYGTIKLGGTNYVKLVDLSNNAAGAGAEAVYAGAVLVPTGSTLDLNGLHLYTRSATVAGSVLNGTISIIPSGGDLPLNTPTTGVLLISGATDQWTFFGHAGQTFTIGVNPGAGSGLAPITPLLNWADVQLVGPGSQLLASGFSAASGAGVTLPATALPSDGTYTVVVKAAAGHTASVGNYVVTAYDVNPTVRPLALNQVLYGNIASPLSTDQWSFSAPAGLQVQFHLASAGATGKGFTLTGPGGYTGFTNLAGDSGIVTLPTAGTYTLTAQSLDGSTGAYAFQLNQVTVNTLPLNGSVGGTLPGSGTSQIYKVTLPVAKPLVVTLDDASSADRVEVYLKQGSLPTRGSYDYKYGSANAADQKVLVPRASAGDWYVLVYGDFVPAPSTFTLSSAATDVQLTGVTPDSYGAAGTLNMTLTGSGFVPGATVRLVAANTTTYAPTNLVIDSYTHATATFNAGAIPVGVYSVRVTLPNADTSTLAGALTLTPPVAGGQPRLETQLIMPSALGRHAAATIYLEYANTGDVAMPAPMIQVGSADPNGTDKPMLTLDASRILYGLYTAALPEGYGTSINILASGEQPGVLNPGERIRVPIYYAGLLRPWDFSDTKVELGMAVVRASDLTPMDWSPGVTSLKPASMSQPAWNAIVGNLQAQVGGTLGSFVQALDANAVFLGQNGVATRDIGELWGFEVLQATGLGPQRLLGYSLDAMMPAPGVALSASRAFINTINGRYRVGLFGHGWAFDWDSRLSVDAAGTAVIDYGGDWPARYDADTRSAGKFLSQPGDTSTLVRLGSGEFELTDTGGTVTRYAADGKLAFVQDSNGNRVSAIYDAQGRLALLTHTSGATLAFAYNAGGRVASITDSAGRATTYAYDATNAYLLTVTTSDNKTVQYTYKTSGGAAGLYALTSIQMQGVTQNYVYDSLGRLDSTALASGAQFIDYGYNDTGLVTVATATGTASIAYDQHGLPVKVTDPLGNATSAVYDANLRITSLIEPTGDRQSLTWNGKGGLTKYTDELGHTVQFAYANPLNRLTTFTDGNGNVTSYAYDSHGNLINTTFANNASEVIAGYSPQGLPGSVQNARGQVTDITYNAAGQITSQSFADGTSNTFAYDARGNLTSATDPSGTTTYDYNYAVDGDRLKKVTYPGGRFLQYTYDANGRRIQMTDQAGLATKYDYDVNGKLFHIRDAANVLLATYAYNPSGQLGRVDKGNGTYTTYEYDAAGEMIHLINRNAANAILSRYDYTYDALGRRTTMSTLDGAWTYTYDAIGELTHAVFASANAAVIPNQDLRYNYDAAGNRTSTVVNGVTTTYSVNSLNQYTTVGGTLFTYDADGNLTSDGVNTYAYDQQNHLLSRTGPGGVTEYEYNALGDRVATIVNGQRTEYLLDPLGTIDATAEYDGSGTLTARNVFGRGLLARSVGSSGAAGSLNYFDFDVIGSAVGLTNAAGSQVNRYAYSPFGATLVAVQGVANPFQFVGQAGITSEGAGASAMRDRTYLQGIGRFTSNDPLNMAGGSLYQYTYAANSPTQFIDATGGLIQIPLMAAGAAIGAVGGGVFYAANWISTGQGSWWGLTGATAGGAAAGALAGTGLPLLGALGGAYGAGLAELGDQIGKGLYSAERMGWQALTGAVTGLIPASWLGYHGGWGAGSPKFWNLVNGNLGQGKLLHYSQIAGTIISGIVGFFLPEATETGVANAFDPNDKFGAQGFGPQAWIPGTLVIPYHIDFENIGPGSINPQTGLPFPTQATAPAQQVTISDPLDPDLDWSTFRLSQLAFGDTIITMPADSSYYSGSVSVTLNGHTFDVLLEAGINLATGNVFAIFQSIDPLTQLPPDVLTGFLPPEDGSGAGKGFFAFTVAPKAALPTGREIRNVALISFDKQKLIATNQSDPFDSASVDHNREALNTIDNGAPSSSIAALPGTSSSATFNVSWSGADDATPGPAGSGIDTYDVFVSDNGGVYTLWQNHVAATSASYAGADGHTYAFYSVARDHVGHVEAAPGAADASTHVVVGVTLPEVSGVRLKGSAWTAGFTGHLATAGLGGADGYAIPAGSGAQLATLPWTNLDQITLRFNEPVTIQQGDLIVRGVNVPAYSTVGFSTGTASDGAFEATWTLSAPLGIDKVLLSLSANVTDGSGHHLDGEWVNPTSTATPVGGSSSFASGDGAEGGAFTFRFNTAPGDVNQNGGINVQDVVLVRNRQGSSTASPANYSVFADVNGNGGINVQDVVLTRNQQGKSLPAGEPALPAGAMAALVIAGSATQEARGLFIAASPKALTVAGSSDGSSIGPSIGDVSRSAFAAFPPAATGVELRRAAPTRWTLNPIDVDADGDSTLLRKLQRRLRLAAPVAEAGAAVTDVKRG